MQIPGNPLQASSTREFTQVWVRSRFLYKNQRQGRAPPNISLPSPKQDGSPHVLCPVTTLQSYVERSKAWCKSSALFCTRKSGAALKASDVDLHICTLIENACTGSIPKCHDVRKIGTSLAWCRGLEPNEIVKRTFWSSSNIFIERYLTVNKDVPPPCVALGTRA